MQTPATWPQTRNDRVANICTIFFMMENKKGRGLAGKQNYGDRSMSKHELLSKQARSNIEEQGMEVLVTHYVIQADFSCVFHARLRRTNVFLTVPL
jgi:hypothetical protein